MTLTGGIVSCQCRLILNLLRSRMSGNRPDDAAVAQNDSQRISSPVRPLSLLRLRMSDNKPDGVAVAQNGSQRKNSPLPCWILSPRLRMSGSRPGDAAVAQNGSPSRSSPYLLWLRWILWIRCGE